MADRLSKVKKVAPRETTVGEDLAAIRQHLIGGAQVSHQGKPIDETVTAAERGTKPAAAKPNGPKYDTSTGSAEHATNVAQSASSDGGTTITASERAHIRELAQAALKKAMSGK